MLSALALTFALALPAPQSTQAPDPARVKAAVAELEKSLAGSDKAEKLKALQKHSELADADVAKALAKGLRDKEPEVQDASIRALRYLAHPKALEELLAFARTEKELRKEPVRYATLLKAIGQYGSKSAIAALGDDVWSVPEHGVVQARILGLGRIRAPEAVEALMDLMKVAGPQRIQNLMGEFRLALVSLTGVDKGQSQQLWQGWWNDNRARFKLPVEAPKLPRELEQRWNAYWSEGMERERVRTKGDRGRGDPEKDAKGAGQG